MAPAPDPIRRALLDAARAFNGGQYFEAHELLEEALEAVEDDAWDLFIGLIQIAVGYHKTTLGMWTSAAGMLARGAAKVAAAPADRVGLKRTPLLQRVRADIERLRAGAFDPAALARDPPRWQLATARTGTPRRD